MSLGALQIDNFLAVSVYDAHTWTDAFYRYQHTCHNPVPMRFWSICHECSQSWCLSAEIHVTAGLVSSLNHVKTKIQSSLTLVNILLNIFCQTGPTMSFNKCNHKVCSLKSKNWIIHYVYTFPKYTGRIWIKKLKQNCFWKLQQKCVAKPASSLLAIFIYFWDTVLAVHNKLLKLSVCILWQAVSPKICKGYV